MSNTHDIRKQREREARMEQRANYYCSWCASFFKENPIFHDGEEYCSEACLLGAVKRNTPLGQQEGGSHYKDMKIQPVEFIHANGIGFLEGNALKYLCRHRAKNGAEDLKKARHYIDLLLQLEYGITGEGV